VHAARAILASLRRVALRATAKTGPPGLGPVHAALAILASLRVPAERSRWSPVSLEGERPREPLHGASVDLAPDAPRNMRPMARHRVRPAAEASRPPGAIRSHPRAVAPLVVLTVLLAACHADAPPVQPAAPTVVSQVEAVRAGRTATITATTPLSPAEWEALRGLSGLRVLELQAGRADDDRARTILATLPDVERLVLRASPLTDEGFAALAGLTTLRDLNVPQAACTAAGVRSLAALPQLRAVRLGGATLHGSDVCEALVTLPGLRSVHLIDVPIGDQGLDVLARLAGLWNLYLDGAGVSDEAWSRYFEARPDVHVHVDQAHHDRDPARHDH
jgi:hypothetical protein